LPLISVFGGALTVTNLNDSNGPAQTTNLGIRSSNLFGRAILPPFRTKLRTLSELRGGGQACPIPEDQLDPVRPLGPEHADRARERTSHHGLAHQRGQSVGGLAEVDRLTTAKTAIIDSASQPFSEFTCSWA
jgi:hypothetical protein